MGREWAPPVEWPSALILLSLLTVWPALAWAGATHRLSVVTAIAGLAVLDYAAFTLMHEATHGLVARGSRQLNQAAGEIAATVLLCRFNGFRQLHLRHHRFTNHSEHDPDMWSGRRPRWAAPLYWATSDLHYWMVFDQAAPLPAHARRAAGWSLVGVVFLLSICLWTGHAWDLVRFWILPARIALFISTWLFDWLPHQRPFGRPRDENPLDATVNLAVPRWLELLLLGHSFHLVHHLFPGVPFHRLRHRWAAERARLEADGARAVPLLSIPTDPRPIDPR